MTVHKKSQTIQDKTYHLNVKVLLVKQMKMRHTLHLDHQVIRDCVEKMDICPQMKKKTKHLPTLASACDCVGVSDQTAALIVSSLLQDIVAVSSQDTSEVVHRNKIRRARQKKRSSLKDKGPSTARGIYFDGRKDLTLKEEKKGEKCYRKKVLEEHITLVVEPGSQYIGHYSLKSGSAD